MFNKFYQLQLENKIEKELCLRKILKLIRSLEESEALKLSYTLSAYCELHKRQQKHQLKLNLHLFQVSRLVIIHEEGEAGHEMPDLSRPIQAVSTAVTNLVKVRNKNILLTHSLNSFYTQIYWKYWKLFIRQKHEIFHINDFHSVDL